MSAKLQFGDNSAGIYFSEYLVAKCECHFSRHHNGTCPDAPPRCDKVMVVAVAPGCENHELVDWYIGQGSQSGRILFDISDSGGASSNDDKLEIFFEDAVCYSMSEEYDVSDSHRRELILEFVSESISVDTVKFG